MIRNVVFVALAFLASMSLSAKALASLVTSVGPVVSPGGSFAGPVITSPLPATPNSFKTPGTTVGGDNPGTPAPSPNHVNLTATVTTLHAPIAANIGIADAGDLGVGIDGAHEYFFTITMLNSTIFPISNVVFELFNPAATPLPAGYFAAVDFDNPSDLLPTPTSSYQGVGTSAWVPHMITFGGLLGGGGEVPPAGTGTFTFSLDLPDGAPIGGFLGLRMTANPEPTSLALAGLGIGLFGMVGYRRRRSKKVSA